MAQLALTLAVARPQQALINAYPQRPIGHGFIAVRGAAYGVTREMMVSVRLCVYVDDIAMHVYRTVFRSRQHWPEPRRQLSRRYKELCQ